jgi:C1A family cysteine protease
MSNRIYGWMPDVPDFRDHKFFSLVSPMKLPTEVDLRPKCPPVYDQGSTGSCTANAIAAAIDFDIMKDGETPITPSRLFIYYNERKMEGTISSDSGAQIRDGIKSINIQGACHESLWEYDESKFTDCPSPEAYADATSYIALAYKRLNNANIIELKSALAQGFPFVCGVSLYESFESDYVAQTGVVSMPGVNEQMLGGHAICCVGYNDHSKMFIMRNSWGPEWGVKGYFFMPYSYLTNLNLADDFWVVTKVE